MINTLLNIYFKILYCYVVCLCYTSITLVLPPVSNLSNFYETFYISLLTPLVVLYFSGIWSVAVFLTTGDLITKESVVGFLE